jgi:Flp pilus assembly protein TadG
MDSDMLIKPAHQATSARIVRKISDFKSDEDGGMAIFVLLIFVVMLMFGGIAVDVMRFETRRVTMQETMDRAALAAASLTQPANMAPKAVADDWFAKAGLGSELTVDYTTPTVTVYQDSSQKIVTATSKVRSYNWFMGMMDVNYLEGPMATEAAQGVSQIEVMMVLDITGSMSSPASAVDTTTKIEALRASAAEFVNLVKANDSQNGVSIGIVPYASQVNIPENLRQQYTGISSISSWNFVANAGVQSPKINCVEIPTSTFTSTALPLTTPMRMGAVADVSSSTSTTTNFVAPATVPPSVAFGPRNCTTKNDDPGTAAREDEYNLVRLPTKDKVPVLAAISQLTAGGNTSIAVGMRWGTALIDQTARDIYTAIGDASVQGRPVNNNDAKTRKIIILMTDGEHVSSNTVPDAYKSGPSPIWRGTDGNYAIRFWAAGGPLNDGVRPSNCSGWTVAASREYFVPHLKANSVKAKFKATDPEGLGSGAAAAVAGACDPRAWLAPVAGNLTWPQLDGSGNVVKDAGGNPIMVTAQRLDWSEVWRFLRVTYVARQLYNRSGVTGTAANYNTLMATFSQTYLTVANMNTFLQENCKAARDEGIEIYGIAFAAPANGQTQIKNCASPDAGQVIYYHNASNNADLTAAFKQIATQIADLRLTQ